MRLLLLILILTINLYSQTARFVSKSGNSTPPYTSWETAVLTIPAALNECIDGDTIFVGIGEFTDSLDINKAVTIMGIDRESSIIRDTMYTTRFINVTRDAEINNLSIIGKQSNGFSKNVAVTADSGRFNLFNVNFEFFGAHVSNLEAVIHINNCSFHATHSCVILSQKFGSSERSIVENSCFYRISFHQPSAISLIDNNCVIIRNNYFLGRFSKQIYSFPVWNKQYVEITNNYLGSTGAPTHVELRADTGIVKNNVFANQFLHSSSALWLKDTDTVSLENNLFINNYKAVLVVWPAQCTSYYNSYYNNEVPSADNEFHHSETDLFINPGLADTNTGEFTEFEDIQKLMLRNTSPLIDAGNPDILDKDGTRSDIGIFWGPYGESYNYVNFPPLRPLKLDAEKVSDSAVRFFWDIKEESDLAYLKLYSFSDLNYTNIIDSVIIEKDSSHTISAIPSSLTYYKLVSVDTFYIESPYSNGVVVNSSGLVGINQELTPYTTELIGNYPNPFNPETTIRFSLSANQSVKFTIYNLLGEKVDQLPGTIYEAGIHELKYNASHLTSGVYFLNMIVSDSRNAPLYIKSKKLLLLK